MDFRPTSSGCVRAKVGVAVGPRYSPAFSKMLRLLIVSALVYLSSGKYADLVLLQDAPEKYVRQGVLLRVPVHQISLGSQTQTPLCILVEL